MLLAQKLRELRGKREWTQREVADHSGLKRNYISYLEQPRHHKRPSAEAMLALARAFNVKPEELYQAAGYIKEFEDTKPRPETPEEILDRLRLAMPKKMPVYPWEAFPYHAGDKVEPVQYVYTTETEVHSECIEAYMVRGDCLEPRISDGDVIIVDRDSEINNGDIVACILDKEFHVLRVRRVAGELWLENNIQKYRFEDCQEVAPVIEFHRRLK